MTILYRALGGISGHEFQCYDQITMEKIRIWFQIHGRDLNMDVISGWYDYETALFYGFKDERLENRKLLTEFYETDLWKN